MSVLCTPLQIKCYPVFNDERLALTGLKLTALPVWVAELQVSAGPGRALLSPVWATNVLDLVVQGFQSGVHLCIMLMVAFGGLVCPHVPQGIRTLFRVRQTSKRRHVDARPRWARKTRGSRISRGPLWRSIVFY